MREKRRWKNEWLKSFAEKSGLKEQAEILVRERSMLKDGSYITRERRTGVVLKLYPHHFYCLMEDGVKESFRYNEFLGYESRLVRLMGSAEARMNDDQLNQVERASSRRFFHAFELTIQVAKEEVCFWHRNGMDNLSGRIKILSYGQ